MPLTIGDQAPSFELPAADGGSGSWDEADGAPATVVFWTCNHCPYAIAWHDRLMETGRDYGERGVRFFAINSNDAQKYPQDSFDAMRQRVAEDGWPMPYLYDESQEVARAYGAERTPDVFVFDSEGKLAYHGAPDADYEDPSQNASWLREALDQVLEGGEVARPETEPVGCTIKWRE